MRRPIGVLVMALLGCATGPESGDSRTTLDTGRSDGTEGDGALFDDVADAPGPTIDVPPIELDVGDGAATDGNLDPDAACAASAVEATPTKLPVDIIWIVDNSVSMAPAVAQVTAGLNDFAGKIGTKGLDYKVVMLSLRSKTSPITVTGSTRYPVCIPPPLAGDANCGDGARFFQSSIDIKSTQPLEQILGTLAQTTGYTPGLDRGGVAWRGALRDAATKTFVLVTDDNSRLSAADFERFAGGTNPNNASLQLPPGLLEAYWKHAFDGYVFTSIYGWGSATDPAVKCTYAGGTTPPSSGPVYTTLVGKTGGVRAKICDGASAWTPFFDAVATAVIQTSKIACDLAIPTPSSGTLDPSAVNVRVVAGTTTTMIPKVANAAACGAGPGWYFDDDLNPTKVVLCATSCTDANAVVGAAKGGKVDVLFGCKTVIR